MKKLLLLSVFVLTAGLSRAQDLSVDDLLEFSSVSSKKFDNYISKKGFKAAGRSFRNDTLVETWQRVYQSPDTTQLPVIRRVFRFQKGKDFSFCLQTSAQQEYVSALAALKRDGFFCAKDIAAIDTSLLFQKDSRTIEASFNEEDSVIYYSLVFRDQAMPSGKILYANDLLQFTSHEYLAAFFGRQHVKRDVYYFSEKEISKCSVLFPNTARQAVFIWEDEENLRGLSQVVISGKLPTAGSAEFVQQQRENTWLLDDGLHFDMRLDELLRLNGEDVFFYGSNTASPFMILPQNNGNINLSATAVILDCINCKGASLLDNKVISAQDALSNDLRLHIGMIILLPETVSSLQSAVSSRQSVAGNR